MRLNFNVPKNWTFPKLEELVPPHKGSIRIGPFGSSLKKAEYSDSGIRVLGIDHIYPNQLVWSKPKYIPLSKYEELTQYTVQAGDILVTNMGTVGRTCFVPNKFPTAIISSHLIKVSPDTSKVESLYLSWVLNYCPVVVAQIRAKCQGAIMAGFNTRLLKSLKIPLPPIEEQRRIAAILDKADAVRRKREEAIRLTEELLRSAFLKLVGSQNPAYYDWKEVSLSELASPKKNSMRTGPFGSTLLHSEFVDEGIAVLGIDNAVQNRFAWGQRRFITLEKYKSLERYTIKPSDVIITIMGTTGRSAVVPEDIPIAINTKHLAAITLDCSKALPEFVSNAIHQDPFILHQIALRNRGAIMAGLNLGIIKELKVRLPPIEQQLKYDKFVKHIRQREDKLQKTSYIANNLFNSLLQKAFRGEL